MEDSSEIELHRPSLAEVDLAGRRLCSRHKIPFDPFRVGVTTDYDTKVVVYLLPEEAELAEAADYP